MMVSGIFGGSTVSVGVAVTPPVSPVSSQAAMVVPTSSPAVINDVKQQAGLTAAGIQASVNGINAQIAGMSDANWTNFIAKYGVAAENRGDEQEAARLFGAEGATVSFASQEGATGVNFNFTQMDFASIPVGSTSGQPAASLF